MLKEEIRKPYFLKLKEFLWEQGVRGAEDSAKSLKVYPARETFPVFIPLVLRVVNLTYHIVNRNTAKNIYSWSNLTPLGRVKVVIIGQDPYHGPGQAHGTSGPFN